MRIVTDHYGLSQDWTTYLEFYSQQGSDGQRIVERRAEHQEAYDLWHLAVRFREIIDCRELLAKRAPALDAIPRKQKHLLLYLLLCSMPQSRRVVELGCSLMEVIDGMELVAEYAFTSGRKLPTLPASLFAYDGIEISDSLAKGAHCLHPGMNLSIYPGCDSYLIDRAGKLQDAALFDLGVASYAFVSSIDLAGFLNEFGASYCYFFVSKQATYHSNAAGKSLTYFGLEELLKNLTKPLYLLFAPPRTGPSKDLGRPSVAGYFLNCDHDVAQRFMELLSLDPNVKAWAAGQDIKLIRAETILTGQETP